QDFLLSWWYAIVAALGIDDSRAWRISGYGISQTSLLQQLNLTQTTPNKYAKIAKNTPGNIGQLRVT
ncbi:MAG: hypothetical protein KZQ72_10940, partial [Candidatus Thiodiazotropha sp. (ex Cardiolucina cf. quadrata)]|nr:hypothetical protein [Candidatus Thiodiazotropha sp. (ex Cardiolucina cf. quadrata)]